MFKFYKNKRKGRHFLKFLILKFAVVNVIPLQWTSSFEMSEINRALAQRNSIDQVDFHWRKVIFLRLHCPFPFLLSCVFSGRQRDTTVGNKLITRQWEAFPNKEIGNESHRGTTVNLPFPLANVSHSVSLQPVQHPQWHLERSFFSDRRF